MFEQPASSDVVRLEAGVVAKSAYLEGSVSMVALVGVLWRCWAWGQNSLAHATPTRAGCLCHGKHIGTGGSCFSDHLCHVCGVLCAGTWVSDSTQDLDEHFEGSWACHTQSSPRNRLPTEIAGASASEICHVPAEQSWGLHLPNWHRNDCNCWL